jgi:hypothetical protein
MKIDDVNGALADAQACTRLEPGWAKGWARLASVLQRKDRLDEAYDAAICAYHLEPIPEYQKIVDDLLKNPGVTPKSQPSPPVPKSTTTRESSPPASSAAPGTKSSPSTSPPPPTTTAASSQPSSSKPKKKKKKKATDATTSEKSTSSSAKPTPTPAKSTPTSAAPAPSSSAAAALHKQKGDEGIFCFSFFLFFGCW